MDVFIDYAKDLTINKIHSLDIVLKTGNNYSDE